MVEEHVAEGVMCAGHRWATLPQDVLLAMLNDRLATGDRIKLRTLQDLIKEPGIVRRRVLVNKKIVCLLRLGEPDPMTPEQEAHETSVRKMASVWKKCRGEKPTRYEYGLIRGLAEVWVARGYDPTRLLSLALRRWGAFMSAARCEPDWVHTGKFYRLPSLRLIRRFPNAAVEMYETLVVEPAQMREYEDVFAESSSPQDS